MIYQESDLHKRHQTDFLGTWIIDSLGRKRVSRLIFGKLMSLLYIARFICIFLIKPVCKSYDRSSELHLVYWHKVLHLFNSSNSIEYKYCIIPNISSGLINIRNFWGLIFGGGGDLVFGGHLVFVSAYQNFQNLSFYQYNIHIIGKTIFLEAKVNSSQT